MKDWKFRYKPFGLFLFGAFFLFLIFRIFYSFIDELLYKWVVIPLWAKANLWSGDLDVPILIVWVIIFYFGVTYLIRSRGTSSRWHQNLIVFFALAVLVFRVWPSTNWHFARFQLCERFTYMDPIFLLGTISIISRVYSLFVPPKAYTNESIFTLESVSNEDEHDRRPKASLIAGELNKIRTESAFGVGVVGKWGSGKSHFMRSILAEMRRLNNDRIFIEFSPWGVSGKTITNEFFELLESRISGELADQFNSYAKQFREKTTRWLGDNPLSILTAENSSGVEQINAAIRRQNRQVVIVIDDIDRLQEEEIIEVFALMRSVANFNNTIYLIAFDIEYVKTALEKINPTDPFEYLDKIIQFKFFLPPANLGFLRKKFVLHLGNSLRNYVGSDKEALGKIEGALSNLKNRVDEFFDAEGGAVEVLGVNSEEKGRDFLHKLNPFELNVNCIRDIYTLTNTVSYGLLSNKSYGFLDSFQIFLVELLKLKHPKLYLSVRSRTILKLNENSTYSLDETQVQNYFKTHNVPSETRAGALSILLRLFKLSGETEPVGNHIHNVAFFNWYFDGSSSLLSEAERVKLFEVSERELLSVLDPLIERKGDGLVKFVLESAGSIERRSWRRFLEISFRLHLWSEEFVAANGLNVVIENISVQSEEIEGFRSELLHVVTQHANRNRHSASWVIGNWYSLIYKNGAFSDKLPSVQSLKMLSLDSLERSIKEKSGFRTVYEALQNCKANVNEHNIIELMPEAIALFRLYIDESPSEYFDNLIRPVPFARMDLLYTLDPFAHQIFGDLDQLLKYITELKTSTKLVEVYSFVLEYKLNEQRSIRWIPSSILIFSDRNTLVSTVEDRVYDFSVAHSHPLTEDVVKTHQWIEPYRRNFIAHTHLISNEEAIKGGKYYFIRRFSLLALDPIKSITLKLWVDDTVIVRLNGRPILEPEYRTDAVTTIEIAKDALVVGVNELEFVVRNYSQEELGWADVTGLSNPYALIYLLQIRM